MTPLPKVGDILHYVFLFSHEKTTGRDEGIKIRPLMVAAVKDGRVFTLAITTRRERTGSTLPIPDSVADSAGLERGTSVVIDQYNHFTWVGFDIRPVADGPTYLAGRMPPGFTSTILSALLAGASAINRD